MNAMNVPASWSGNRASSFVDTGVNIDIDVDANAH
jgi:hypothetical protein